jgi:hypothetical protein
MTGLAGFSRLYLPYINNKDYLAKQASVGLQIIEIAPL